MARTEAQKTIVRNSGKAYLQKVLKIDQEVAVVQISKNGYTYRFRFMTIVDGKIEEITPAVARATDTKLNIDGSMTCKSDAHDVVALLSNTLFGVFTALKYNPLK